jgi:hypothetical protein
MLAMSGALLVQAGAFAQEPVVFPHAKARVPPVQGSTWSQASHTDPEISVSAAYQLKLQPGAQM